MGLTVSSQGPWIETDLDVGRYHRHKLALRRQRGEDVYRATASSLPAQRELADLLLQHLLRDQARHYHREGGDLHCTAGGFRAPIDGDECLWLSSLWIADDLVLMEDPGDGRYRLTAASLCSPSHWRLADKFGLPLREIHDPIPDFHARLTPRIERYFEQLRPGPPFVRYNWSLQAGDELAQFPGEEPRCGPDADLYYRVERQSLTRLPNTGAIAFTIRVYLDPLESLLGSPGALPALLDAVETTPPPLARYKGFDRLAPALARYRTLARHE